jgi:hypothetical protein
MTPQERFNQLSLEDRASVFRAFAKFVSHTDVDLYRVQLYELEGHFIEVWFDPIKNKVEKLVMPDYEELDKHLDNITLQI